MSPAIAKSLRLALWDILAASNLVEEVEVGCPRSRRYRNRAGNSFPAHQPGSAPHSQAHSTWQRMHWAQRDGFNFTIEAPQAGIALAGQEAGTTEVWDRAMNSIRTRHTRVFKAERPIPAQDSGLEDDESHEHSQRTLIRVAELKRQYDEVSAQLVDAAAARAAAVAEAAEAVAARKAAEDKLSAYAVEAAAARARAQAEAAAAAAPPPPLRPIHHVCPATVRKSRLLLVMHKHNKVENLCYYLLLVKILAITC